MEEQIILRAKHPREQGLKLGPLVLTASTKPLRAKHPREQGLKHKTFLRAVLPKKSSSETSTRTRIETSQAVCL